MGIQQHFSKDISENPLLIVVFNYNYKFSPPQKTIARSKTGDKRILNRSKKQVICQDFDDSLGFLSP